MIISTVWTIASLVKPLKYPFTLAKSEDPDEMPQNAAFHQGLHCMLKFNNLKYSS